MKKVGKIEGKKWAWRWTKHAATISLKAHEMKSRAEDISGQIRSLNLEISNLEADIKKGRKRTFASFRRR
jgi:hypothetical protein